MGQATAQVPDEHIRGVEQFMGQSGAGDEVAHQNEQRNDRKRVGKAGFMHDLGGARQRRAPTAREADAHNPNQSHAERQGHTEQGHRKDGDKSKKCFGHSVPPSPSWISLAGFMMKDRCTSPVSAHRTLIP